jgi:hypothetical protein
MMDEFDKRAIDAQCDPILEELFRIGFTEGHDERVVMLSLARFLGFMLASAFPAAAPLDATLGALSGIIRTSHDQAVAAKESLDLMKRMKGDAK